MRYYVDFYLNGQLSCTEIQRDVTFVSAKEAARSAVAERVADRADVRVANQILCRFPE